MTQSIAIPIGPGQRWAVFMRFLERPDLQADDRLLLAVLLAHCNGKTGRINPSIARLARLMGRCANTVKAARERLIQAGILTVVFRGHWHAHYALTELLPPPQKPSQDDADPSPGDGDPSRHDGSPPTGVEPRLEPPAAPAERLRMAARKEGPHLAVLLDDARVTVEERQLHIACRSFIRDRLKVEFANLRRCAALLGLEVNTRWIVVTDG